MAAHNWKDIEREDVLAAINIFLSENPEYPAPRSTFLVYDGKKLPAKHIRGMAYKVAFGREISKNEYAGGMETVRFFKNLGFEVSYTRKCGTVPETKAEEKQAKLKQDTSLRADKKQAAPASVVSRATPATAIAREAEQRQPQPQKPDIRIAPKGTREQKYALQKRLNRLFDGDVVCEKQFQWLKTPDKIAGHYSNVYDALFQYRGDTSFAKKNVALCCDFVIESKRLIIEYDERQHFTEARRLALLSYPDVPVCYEDEDFYLDLVFYHSILKCHVLIDLKIGKLTHGDVGQMDSYIRMFDALYKNEDDNPTIGIILCSQKNEAIVKYSVLNDEKQVFASKYQLTLPSAEELQREIEEERRRIEEHEGPESE